MVLLSELVVTTFLSKSRSLDFSLDMFKFRVICTVFHFAFVEFSRALTALSMSQEKDFAFNVFMYLTLFNVKFLLVTRSVVPSFLSK